MKKFFENIALSALGVLFTLGSWATIALLRRLIRASKENSKTAHTSLSLPTTMSRAICIIPAKKNSERLPQKNFLPLGGVPLWIHTVEHALKEDFEFVVSTDSQEIIDECKKKGWRYFEETVDDSDMSNCVRQVLTEYEDYDYYIILQPTSPFREYGILKYVKTVLDTNPELDIVYTAQKVKPIGLCIHSGKEKFIINKREQDSKSFLFQYDGNTLAGRVDVFKREQQIFFKGMKSKFVIDAYPFSIQIDTLEEYLFLSKIYFTL